MPPAPSPFASAAGGPPTSTGRGWLTTHAAAASPGDPEAGAPLIDASAGAGAGSGPQPGLLHRVRSAAPPLPLSGGGLGTPRASQGIPGGEDGADPTPADFTGPGPAAEAAAADAAARLATARADLERLRGIAKTFEREHEFFYTGMEGWGALLSLIAFLDTWVAGLGGASQLSALREDPRVNLSITVAGLTGGIVTALQRLWAPSVRATYYRNSRDAYARVRKKAKATMQAAAVGGGSGSGGETSSTPALLVAAAGLEATARALESRLDDLYDTSPNIPIDRDGFSGETRGAAGFYAFLSFGSLFAPCAACCGADAGGARPAKPADARPRREEAWV